MGFWSKTLGEKKKLQEQRKRKETQIRTLDHVEYLVREEKKKERKELERINEELRSKG